MKIPVSVLPPLAGCGYGVQFIHLFLYLVDDSLCRRCLRPAFYFQLLSLSIVVVAKVISFHTILLNANFDEALTRAQLVGN